MLYNYFLLWKYLTRFRNNTEVISSNKGCMSLELRDFPQSMYLGEAGAAMPWGGAGEFSEGL